MNNYINSKKLRNIFGELTNYSADYNIRENNFSETNANYLEWIYNRMMSEIFDFVKPMDGYTFFERINIAKQIFKSFLSLEDFKDHYDNNLDEFECYSIDLNDIFKSFSTNKTPVHYRLTRARGKNMNEIPKNTKELTKKILGLIGKLKI